MAGCYGGSMEDKYFESKLLDHLDEPEEELCWCCGDPLNDDGECENENCEEYQGDDCE